MEKKILKHERLEGRFKRGMVLHRCELECGHVTRCRTEEVKRGKTHCMECYFAEHGLTYAK